MCVCVCASVETGGRAGGWACERVKYGVHIRMYVRMKYVRNECGVCEVYIAVCVCMLHGCMVHICM